MSQITIDGLFYGAYAEAGLITLEQTGLNADQTEECRQVFNKMKDAWALDGRMTSHIARRVFDIIPSQADYLVGQNGDWDPGYFQVRMMRAGVIVSSEPGSSGPPEYKMKGLTVDEYQSWILKEQVSNWPWFYYYESSYPLAIMHLLYVPSDANQVALYLEETIADIEATGDALLDFRPGFQDMIESNLALRIAARRPGHVINPDVKERARSSMALVMSTNHIPLKRENDMQRNIGRTNVYTGSRYSY